MKEEAGCENKSRPITILVPASDMEAIEDARYLLRKPTRTEAILYLIRRGLEAVANERTGS